MSAEDNLEIEVVDLLPGSSLKTIYLTSDQSAYITLEWLPQPLIDLAREQFSTLFSLRPEKRGKVFTFGQTVDSPRWHQTFLHTPKFDPTAKRSYMFFGTSVHDAALFRDLPTAFQPYFAYVNRLEIENGRGEYNQAVLNWYADGNDYIAPHSDCQFGMQPGASIAVVSFGSDGDDVRTFRLKRRASASDIALYTNLDIPSRHGMIITMGGTTQDTFRHCVPRKADAKEPRISLTMRKMIVVEKEC